MFTSPLTKPVYYEDLYGERNPDEEFDRLPDLCEEESTSGEESEKPKQTSPQPLQARFFARFRGPKRKQAESASEVESARFGEAKRKKGE